MKNGNIFIDKEGLDISKIDIKKRNLVLRNYIDMRKRALENRDKFFFVKGKEWDDFYNNIWSQDNPYWENVEMTIITSLQNDFCYPTMIGDVNEFNMKQDPKTHGGLGYDAHPLTEYVHNVVTWEDWHFRWNLQHPDEPEADALHNGIWLCPDRVSAILCAELKQAKIDVPTELNEICNVFHEQIMKHLDERNRISEAKRIGAAICEANYYHREVELEKLETDHGNEHAEQIYSIKIGENYQFLSIDKQHGMLEWCNDKGEHQMEIRFDGTKNKDGDINHSLLCVAEWKQKYNKM